MNSNLCKVWSGLSFVDVTENVGPVVQIDTNLLYTHLY